MELPLRDREFTKEELARLEKKTWIEIKDLIFETEPQVLDYLSYHCKRWRVTASNNLADISLAKNKVKGSGRRKELNTMNSTIRSTSQPPAANINVCAQKKGATSGNRTGGNVSPQLRVQKGLEDGGNTLLDGSIEECSLDPDEDANNSQTSSRRRTHAEAAKGQPDETIKKPMTPGTEGSEMRRRKQDAKVIMPEKGSCKS